MDYISGYSNHFIQQLTGIGEGISLAFKSLKFTPKQKAEMQIIEQKAQEMIYDLNLNPINKWILKSRIVSALQAGLSAQTSSGEYPLKDFSSKLAWVDLVPEKIKSVLNNQKAATFAENCRQIKEGHQIRQDSTLKELIHQPDLISKGRAWEPQSNKCRTDFDRVVLILRFIDSIQASQANQMKDMSTEEKKAFLKKALIGWLVNTDPKFVQFYENVKEWEAHNLSKLNDDPILLAQLESACITMNSSVEGPFLEFAKTSLETLHSAMEDIQQKRESKSNFLTGQELKELKPEQVQRFNQYSHAIKSLQENLSLDFVSLTQNPSLQIIADQFSKRIDLDSSHVDQIKFLNDLLRAVINEMRSAKLLQHREREAIIGGDDYLPYLHATILMMDPKLILMLDKLEKFYRNNNTLFPEDNLNYQEQAFVKEFQRNGDDVAQIDHFFVSLYIVASNIISEAQKQAKIQQDTNLLY